MKLNKIVDTEFGAMITMLNIKNSKFTTGFITIRLEDIIGFKTIAHPKHNSEVQYEDCVLYFLILKYKIDGSNNLEVPQRAYKTILDYSGLMEDEEDI